MVFREDDSRLRERNAVCHWALLRKMALNLLGRDAAKISLKAKRKKAAWDNDYMAQLLQRNFMRQPWGLVEDSGGVPKTGLSETVLADVAGPVP